MESFCYYLDSLMVEKWWEQRGATVSGCYIDIKLFLLKDVLDDMIRRKQVSGSAAQLVNFYTVASPFSLEFFFCYINDTVY